MPKYLRPMLYCRRKSTTLNSGKPLCPPYSVKLTTFMWFKDKVPYFQRNNCRITGGFMFMPYTAKWVVIIPINNDTFVAIEISTPVQSL